MDTSLRRCDERSPRPKFNSAMGIRTDEQTCCDLLRRFGRNGKLDWPLMQKGVDSLHLVSSSSSFGNLRHAATMWKSPPGNYRRSLPIRR